MGSDRGYLPICLLLLLAAEGGESRGGAGGGSEGECGGLSGPEG